MADLAWVTGAGKGIGRAVALELAGRGWIVAATARTGADLEALAGEARPGLIIPFPGDVTEAAQMESMVGRIEAAHGPISLALLNAGSYVRFGVEDFSVAGFEAQIALNLMGTVHCLAPLIRQMTGRRCGRIGVVSSLTAYRGLPLASAYGASKAALTNMCEALRPELRRHGVTLSVIHPGFVRTPLTDQNTFPMPFLVDADRAARRIVDGLEGNRFEIAFPWPMTVLLKLARILPYRLYFAFTRGLLKP